MRGAVTDSRRARRLRGHGASLLLALLCGVPTASASIYDIYGFGARGISLGGAMVTLADDFSATFYNPAAVTLPSDVRYGGSFIVAAPFFDVGLARPACTEGAVLCSARLGAFGYSRREAHIPETFAGFSLGWVIPFDVGLGRLSTGVSLYVPTINLIRAEALDPATPQFYLYQNLPDQLVILLSLGWAPLDWFSVGAGVQVLADVFGSAGFALDAGNGSFDSGDIEVEIVPKMAATAGVLFMPSEDLRIGLSYRQELGLSFALPAQVDVNGLLVIGLDTAGSVLYTPHQLLFGASYRVAPINLTLAAGLDWALWSRAPDPSPQVAVRVGGDVLETLGLDGTLDVGDDAPPIDLGFRDTVTSRLGVEWGPLEWLVVRAGYAFRPTPAPKATGTANYLDNDTHQIGFGARFTFMDPLAVHPKPISLDIGNMFSVLARRVVRKSDLRDPVGDLEHSGFAYTLSVTVTHEY